MTRRRAAIALSLAIVAAVVVSRIREVLARPIETPARRDPAEAVTRLPGIATTGEPAKDHPLAPGEERSPRSAVAMSSAARESPEATSIAPGAGDSYARPPLGVLGPAPCRSPTEDGPCALRLGHPVGPEMPGGGHLP